LLILFFQLAGGWQQPKYKDNWNGHADCIQPDTKFCFSIFLNRRNKIKAALCFLSHAFSQKRTQKKQNVFQHSHTKRARSKNK
jgi:hypothetical protein